MCIAVNMCCMFATIVLPLWEYGSCNSQLSFSEATLSFISSLLYLLGPSSKSITSNIKLLWSSKGMVVSKIIYCGCYPEAVSGDVIVYCYCHCVTHIKICSGNVS